MTAVVVNSQLNPLANAFIPTNSEFSANKKTIQHLIESENEAKTTWERRGKRNSNDLKFEYKTRTEKLDYQNVLWKDIIFFGSVTSVLNVSLKNSGMLCQTGLRMLGCSQLPIFPGCLTDDDQKVVQKCKADISSKPLAEEDECSCPPMFGWIIPPDFIGNPFNFKYECSKKYPHSPNCTVKHKSDVDTPDYEDTKISQLTLDECVSEMKDILADVYETISVDSDPITKWDEKYKIQDFLEVSDSDSSDEECNDSNGLGTELTSQVENEPELVDDGIHPLLQSGPTAIEGGIHPLLQSGPTAIEDNKDIKNVQEILGRSLSSSVPEYLGAATLKVGAACNPPCSIWCEFLPSAAKDAFRKYVQKSGNANEYKECHQLPAFGYRPMFKRSLSADDASMYDRISKSLNNTSETESREMLLLRRKDPLNYFKRQSSNILTEGKKHGSCDLIDQQLLASSIKSNMWGKFDGADSLWQPLPECNAVNSHTQKQNFKKGREMRQQRTMS